MSSVDWNMLRDYLIMLLVSLIIRNASCQFSNRELMHAMKKVRVAWMVMMNVMISNFMAGMELYRDNFNDLNIKCSMVDLFRQLFGLFFSFA